MEWLDRDKQKDKLFEWLKADSYSFLLTVQDSQEFEDITNWLSSLPDILLSIAYLNTDSEVTRFSLLEALVKEFGKDKFPNFMSLFESKSESDINIIINQTIGADVQSESSVRFDNNHQITNVNKPDPGSLKQFFLESKIAEFFDHFLQDLYEVSKTNFILIVCRFRGNGFDKLDEKFKSWFQDQFLRKSRQNKSRVLILCEQNADNLGYLIEYHNQCLIGDLELNDILPVSKKFLNDEDGLFCKGIVNENDKVAYNLFKLKLQKTISA